MTSPQAASPEAAPRWDRAADSATADDEQIRPENPERFAANDIIHIPATGESLLVVNRDGDTLVVKRALGKTKAAPILKGHDLLQIGVAESE